MSEARLISPDEGFRFVLPPGFLEAVAERAAQKVLSQLDVASAASSPYLAIAEAAEYLRCKRQRVDNLLSAGRLTRVKDGRRTLIARAELDDYLAGIQTGRLGERLKRVAPERPHGRQSGSQSRRSHVPQSARPHAAALASIVAPST